MKVKFDDFRQITKSYTLDRQIDSFSVLHSTMQRLREQIYFKRKRVRLLGVSISNLEDEHLPGEQLKIWI